MKNTMKKTFAFLLAFSLVAGTASAAVNTGGLLDTSVKASAREANEGTVKFTKDELLAMQQTDSKYTMEKDGVVLTADSIVNGPYYYGVTINERGANFTITAPEGKVLKEVDMTFSLGSMDKIFMDGDTEATSFTNTDNIKNAVFSDINKNSVTFSNTFGDAVIDSIDVIYDDAPEVVSDYTISIPSTLDVAQAGYNATEGVTAKGTLAKHDKLVITADSDGEFALTSGDNKVRYNLISEENTEAVYSDTAEAPTWEFRELTDKGVNQPLGVVVENFDDKPAGEYTDTVTFTAKLEDVLQSIELNKSSMVLYNIDGYNTKQLSVTYNPEDTTDDKTVTWESSDPNIATVDQDGNVTAVATGDAVITAKVGDKTASCNVAVKDVTGVADALEDGSEIVLNFNDKYGAGHVTFKNNNGTFDLISKDGWFPSYARASVNSSGKLVIEICAHFWERYNTINTFTFDPGDDTFKYRCGGYNDTILTSLVINGKTVNVTEVD